MNPQFHGSLNACSAILLSGVLASCANMQPAAARDSARARATADSIARVDSIRRDSIAAARSDSIARDSARVAGAGTKRDRASSAADSAAPAEVRKVWPVAMPAVLPGSILPAKRIVAFYGNPLSKRMGVLGELAPDEMLAKLDREVKAWEKADPAVPVQKALHLIAMVAQGSPGRDGKYRLMMDSALIEKVYGWAQRAGAILFLDVQVGQSTLQQELPKLERFLVRPDVHLGIDPEFSMNYGAKGHAPGTRIGTFDAADVNYASSYLAGLVTKYRLPPKVLVVHRFTRPMVRNSKDITLDSRVQVVMNMDGWGPPFLKRDSYQAYIYTFPVQFTGFKLFYHNDTKKGHPLMKPEDVLALFPRPIYIQYQ